MQNIKIKIVNCFLCLKINEHCQNSIAVNSTEWEELRVKYIVEKHLWKMENLYDHSHICQSCWRELYDFHHFYLKIEKVHTKWNILTKTDVIPIDVTNAIEELTENNSIENKENYKLESEVLFISEESPLKIFEEDVEEVSCLRKSAEDKKDTKSMRQNFTKSNSEKPLLRVNSFAKIKKPESDNNRHKIDINLKEVENESKETKRENYQLESEILFIKEESPLKNLEELNVREEVSSLKKSTKRNSSLKIDTKSKRKNVLKINSEKPSIKVISFAKMKKSEADNNLGKIGIKLKGVGNDSKETREDDSILESETLFIKEKSSLKKIEDLDEFSCLKINSKRNNLLKINTKCKRKNVAKSNLEKSSLKLISSVEIMKPEAANNPDKIDINFTEVENDYKETKNDNSRLESDISFLKAESAKKILEEGANSLKTKSLRKNVAKKFSHELNSSTEIKKPGADSNTDKSDINLKEVENDSKENKTGESFNDHKPETNKNIDGIDMKFKKIENFCENGKLESFNNQSDSDNDTSTSATDSPKLDQLPQEEDEFIAEHFQIKCSVCQISLATYFTMLKHCKEEHNQRGYVRCCNTKFYTRALLMDHIKLHLNPEYFKCKYCNKLLCNRVGLKTHIKNIHEQERVECDICGKRLATESSLKTHKILHDDENKKLRCKQCDKSYVSKATLANHVRSVHLNSQSRICDLCGQSLSNPSKFKRHMSEHEGRVKPTVTCEVCGRRLSDIGCLRRHMHSHHPAEGVKTDFKCHHCAKVFTSNSNLKHHIWSVHENKYLRKCTLCEKTFKKSGALKDHMAWHSGKPLRACGICPRTFFSSGNMHAHRKRQHPKEWAESIKEKFSGNLPEKYVAKTTES